MLSFESVRITNRSNTAIPLDGWRIGDSTATGFWPLTAADGSVSPGQSVTVIRTTRPMSLNNNGDTIRLLNPAGDVIDTETYPGAASGELIVFD